MQDARLDSYSEAEGTIHMGVQGLEMLTSDVLERNGKIIEKATARYIPLKLSFSNVRLLKRSNFFTILDQYPADDPSRVIAYMHSWIQPDTDDIFHMFGLRGSADAKMNFFADSVSYEQSKGGELFTFERDYSPSPPMPDSEVPQPYDIYERFGGDPVTFKLYGGTVENKLFVGGIEIQPDQRPEIDAVLNLGEQSSAWVKDNQLHPDDRTVEKGEGAKGMSADEIREEANWVVERLQKNKSVLVHCVAGMNRSTTITCAVLMQLEGLTAEQAIQRVYEHHPWAKPDPHHWLMLRWLEKNKKE